ncbi:hypothetical protein [Streptomyces sp. B27]|uniref:hypothetical protein n=1 Tax=Streptomyces sp. B27 TaxID=2485015 RepID=UPI001F0C55D2|nr:hypothetical protein [Streptomyces sp. B27]
MQNQSGRAYRDNSQQEQRVGDHTKDTGRDDSHRADRAFLAIPAVPGISSARMATRIDLAIGGPSVLVHP